MPNIDRRDDEMPTQSLLMRYQSPYPRKSAYAKPDNFKPSALNRGLEDLSGDGKITKKDVLIGRGVIDASASKKAAPLKRGVGSKSIRDRINEDGAKRKAGKAPTKRFCGGMSKPYKK